MRYDAGSNAAEHFRLVVGYDRKTDQVVYHDPAEPDGAYRRMKRAKFLKLWPLKYEKKWWTVIRLRLEPAAIEKRLPVEGFTNADYAQHMMVLRRKIPDPNFSVILQKPFFVIGNQPPAMVRRWARRTVKWAVDLLKRDYFEKDPDEIIDIWLFADDTSYRKYARLVFADNPSTPFGYYSDRHNALVMNVATGGGTLVHEIVHPFIRANFPQCPAWFNEGLASLYEQSTQRNGRIWGLTNWRLANLQEKIRKKQLPSFARLIKSGDDWFYGAGSGDNYAQARYLCYYLQEKNLLRTFYHKFATNCRSDPTGYQTLKKVLGENDMDTFQKRWEQFVLKLHFP